MTGNHLIPTTIEFGPQSGSIRVSLKPASRRLAPVLVSWSAIGFEVSNEVVDDSLDQCFLAREMVM